MNLVWIALLLSCLIGSQAVAEVYQWVDSDGRRHFSDRAPSGRNTHNPAEQSLSRPSSQATSIGVSALEGISSRDYQHLRKLLRARQFGILNTRLEKYHQILAEDISTESQVRAIYQVFDMGKPGLEHYFNDWVRTYPNLEFPYLARATYLTGLGWDSYEQNRTHRSDEQAEAIRKYFYASLTDIDAALRVNPRSGLAYSLLIGAAVALGDDEQHQLYLQRAAEEIPASLLVASTELGFMTPRWGGSKARMRAYANRVIVHQSSNPALSVLPGYVEALLAEAQLGRQQYAAAEAGFTRALKYGHVASFYRHRAEARMAMKRYSAALDDFAQALRLESADADSYLGRAQIYGSLRQYRNAAAELAYATEIDPESPGIHRYRTQLLTSLTGLGIRARTRGQLEESLDFLGKALMLDPADAVASYQRAVTWMEMGKMANSESDASVALAADSARPEWFVLMDNLLARRQRWQDMIELWDDYIDRFGETQDALLARANAYVGKQEYQSAMADANRAAVLGAPAAAGMISKVESLLATH
ncbi:DUF4124 domain-containing protein [Oceanobacter sp. 4_MG-2023]|uniref:DUF4124 domain-containing protein n=1 Tax=Oceanobacter sp. 4_MG-2023 TaxID=3062623 RepID=UPI002734E063|nr:DUF4124 domain-containing protein [Oceanobacter sp. 4_MG-2023]MDP2547263.1 DUF4124 domain-containing protein [Oceanobacter sp. 4_MG-2023]